MALEIQPILDFDVERLDERSREWELLPLVIGYAPDFVGDKPSHVIIHAQPRWCLEHVPTFRQKYPDAVLAAYTTWEAWPAPVPLCRELSEAFDLLIVPSRFCADAFAEGGFPIHRLRVLPHCFDPEKWPEVPERVAWDGPFAFIWVGNWSGRKNPFGLLRAYLTEFTNEEAVLLRLLTPSYIEADVDALRVSAQLSSYPQVEIVPGISDAAYWHFFADADCYVTASRGEGFGLPAFDAACMGLPVIAPAFGGSRDFLGHYPRSTPYPYQLTPCVLPLTPDGAGGAKLVGPDFLTGRQCWAEPDLSALRRCMRSAYEGAREGRARPPSGRHLFEDRYSYETVGRQFVKILKTFLKEEAA